MRLAGLVRAARSHVLRLALLLLAGAFGLGGGATAARADGLFRPASAADIRAAEGARAVTRLGQVRSRLVEVDRSYLEQRLMPAGPAEDRTERSAGLPKDLTLELFPDMLVKASRRDLAAALDGGVVWSGEVDGDALGDVVLVVDAEGRITGHVQAKRRTFRIEPVGHRLHRILEIDTGRLPREGEPPEPRRRGAGPQNPVTADEAAAVVLRFTAAQGGAATPASGRVFIRGEGERWQAQGVPSWLELSRRAGIATRGGQKVTIRPRPAGLAPGLYTASLRFKHSGGGADTVKVTLRITGGTTPPPGGTTVDVLVVFTPDAAAASANPTADAQLGVGLANSGYARSGVPLTMRLVGVRTATGYAESNYDRLLDDATDGIGAFAAVHSARDSLGADLVAVITNLQQYCGLGWMPNPGPTTDGYGYSVTTLDCISGHTLAHETGHNMGLDHDRYVVGSAPTSVYNFGHVDLAGGFNTIMAYPDRCRDAGISCRRINNFSSPLITEAGRATGVPQYTAGAADNARRLRETMAIIAAYRPTLVPDRAGKLAEAR